VLGGKTTVVNAPRKLAFEDSGSNAGGSQSIPPIVGVNDGESLDEKVEVRDTTIDALEGVIHVLPTNKDGKDNITMQVEGVVMEGDKHGMEVDGKESGWEAVVTQLVVESGIRLNSSEVVGACDGVQLGVGFVEKKKTKDWHSTIKWPASSPMMQRPWQLFTGPAPK
jgi:hypothetical protein